MSRISAAGVAVDGHGVGGGRAGGNRAAAAQDQTAASAKVAIVEEAKAIAGE